MFVHANSDLVSSGTILFVHANSVKVWSDSNFELIGSGTQRANL